MKKKPGRPKKVIESFDVPKPTVPVNEPEDMAETEVEGMIERKEQKEVEAVKKVELSVDSQEWSKNDPVIPDDLKGRVWVAVFKCPVGHKTKATNRQDNSGIKCFECGKPSQIMSQFTEKPKKDSTKAVNRLEKV
jgi:hypothetical protein